MESDSDSDIQIEKNPNRAKKKRNQLSDSDDGPTMIDQLKAAKFQKTSKLVWKLTTDNYVITFVGSGPDPGSYDIRIRVADSDLFGDNDMRMLWMQLRDEPNPVAEVVKWAELNAKDDDAPGFSVEVAVDSSTPALQLTLKTRPNPDRQIKIYTYGIAMRQHKPDDSQRNWFVGTITTRPKGVDLRKYNGRSAEVQAGIVADNKFNPIMSSIIDAVETDNLQVISIACTKGRHRSVAIAELLKRWFYPNAQVIHLTIS
jgi:hypothetical protein